MSAMEADLPAIDQAAGAAMAALDRGDARLQLVGRATAGKSSALREIASRLASAGPRRVARHAAAELHVIIQSGRG